MQSSQAKIDSLERGPKLDKNGQACILPPCSAIGWGLPEKTDLGSKAEALTAGDDQIATFLEAGLLSPLLERDLSAAALCHQKYLWKFQTEVG